MSRKYNPIKAEALARMKNSEATLWEIYCAHCQYGWSVINEKENKPAYACSRHLSPYTYDRQPCVYYENEPEWRHKAKAKVTHE